MESPQPGDVCLECLSQGLNNKLRFFYLNLEEQLLKCESRSCLWPHNDAVSSDEEDDVVAPPSEITNADADEDEFIKQLLQQLAPDNESSETLPHLNLASCDSNVTESDACNIDDILSISDLWASELLNNAPNTEHSPKIKLSPVTSPTTTTTTYSMPDLLNDSAISEQLRIPTEHQVKLELEQTATAAPEIEPIIGYTISFPAMPQSPKTKANLFQTPPKKASTMVRSQQQKQLQAQPEPELEPEIVAAATPLPTASLFLDALKRTTATSTATATRPVRGVSVARRQTRGVRGSVGGGRLSGGLLEVKQKLERIEAHSRQREPEAKAKTKQTH